MFLVVNINLPVHVIFFAGSLPGRDGLQLRRNLRLEAPPPRGRHRPAAGDAAEDGEGADRPAVRLLHRQAVVERLLAGQRHLGLAVRPVAEAHLRQERVPALDTDRDGDGHELRAGERPAAAAVLQQGLEQVKNSS